MSSFRPTDSDPSAPVARPTHVVLGGGHVGLAIAERLQTDGHAVVVVDEAYDAADVPGVAGSPTDVDVLTESGLETASTAIVATRSDAKNLLVAQLARTQFDVPRIVVLVHDPGRLAPLAEAGHEPVCATAALSETITERA